MTDDAVIALIQKGGRDYEDGSDYLFYAYRGYIPKVQSKLNLSQDDVHNAYADALVKLIRQIKTSSFRGESKLSTYFYRIFNNAAVDVSRHNASNKILDTEELTTYSAKERDLMELILVNDQVKELRLVMDKLGGSCKSILIDWGYHGYSMAEIAERSNLASTESARSMKHKCLKKLKDIISQSQ